MSNNDKQDRKGQEPGPGFTRFNFNNRIALIALLILIAFFVFFFVQSERTSSQQLAYSVFLSHLEQGQVEAVKIVDNSEITGTPARPERGASAASGPPSPTRTPSWWPS